MKQGIRFLLCCVLSFSLGMLLIRTVFPVSSVPAAAAAPTTPPETEALESAALSTETTQPVIAPVLPSFDARFHLPVLRKGSVVTMSLEDYVLGALLGEMPTSFAPEALKAQAIAIRTYALRQYQYRKHENAAVCTDPSCCMNWVDPSEYEAQYGTEAFFRAKKAIQDTDALAIYYMEEPICATFFSCACGKTEDASDVWGGEVPYLRSVDSPDENAPYGSETVCVSNTDFVQALQASNEMAVFPDNGGSWIGETTYTSGGGVETIELGGCIYTGVQLRGLFGLRSTDFSVIQQGNDIIFTTHGFGHRVGLSQYGADEMARNGKSYQEILQWYYSGVTIKSAENQT